MSTKDIFCQNQQEAKVSRQGLLHQHPESALTPATVSPCDKLGDTVPCLSIHLYPDIELFPFDLSLLSLKVYKSLPFFND